MTSEKALTLSLIILVYNEQDYLKACLEAVAAQTEAADEVIVVDNNSTDGSIEIAKTYPFAKIIKETKQGMAYARNAGFNAAQSKLLTRIDADSILDSDYVEQIKRSYRSAGEPKLYAGATTVRFRNRGPKSLWFILHRVNYFWPAKLLLGGWPLYGPTTIISKELYKKVAYNTCNYNWLHEDMDLTWHVHKAGIKVNFSTQPRSSVLARKMIRRSFYYPLMMLLARFSPRHFFLRQDNKK